MRMAYFERQARRATLPRISAISCTLYARCIGIYRPSGCNSEEWSPIPLETTAPSVHGQYKVLGLQDTHPATHRPILRGTIWVICDASASGIGAVYGQG